MRWLASSYHQNIRANVIKVITIQTHFYYINARNYDDNSHNTMNGKQST